MIILTAAVQAKLLAIYVWLSSIVFTSFPPSRVHPNDLNAQRDYIIHVNEVVKDIAAIEYDPNHRSWFTGKYARAKEAALVTIISSGESGGYDPDVENGIKRGDHGSSWCLMAINIGRGKTAEGWTGPDLIEDRKKCLYSGLRIMQRSLNVCRSYGTLSGLSAYDTGRCIEGEEISVRRMSRMSYAINKLVPEDEEVMKEILETAEIENENGIVAD